MTQIQAPVIKNFSNITPVLLDEIKTNYINNYINIINYILQIPNDSLCWMNLVYPLINFKNKFTDIGLLQMNNFHTNKNIRNKCNEILIELYNFSIDQSTRKDLYYKFKYYANNQYIKEKRNMSIEEHEYFDNLMVEYVTNGINLPHLDYINKIKKSINELSFIFNKNLNDSTNSTYILLKSDLAGLPQQYITDRQHNNDTIIVTLNEDDYKPIMEYAIIRDIRKKFYILYNNRYNNENQNLITQIISLRNELSQLFMYDNYINYKCKLLNLDNESVQINELINKGSMFCKKDIELLSKLARIDGIDNLELYDINYYSRIYNNINLNHKSIKYYPILQVISETFESYQKLYGIYFKKVYDLDSTFWDESIELYHVYDNKTNIVGYFYLDLFQRIGKTNNIECIPFINKSDISVPVATLNCNFINNNLTLEQIAKFYNAFGNVMYHLNLKITISNLTFLNYDSYLIHNKQFFNHLTRTYISDLLMKLDIEYYNDLIKNQPNELSGFNNAYELMFKLFKLEMYSSANLNCCPNTLFIKIQKEVLRMNEESYTSTTAYHYLL
jgi:Zn-dependent oligopeptidase